MKLSPALRDLADDMPPLLGTDELAGFLRVSPRTVEAWRVRGGGPEYIRASKGMIRYARAAVLEWLAERAAETPGHASARASA
jgi:phage terminase Nu1 subunit (DNA packaging protein)